MSSFLFRTTFSGDGTCGGGGGTTGGNGGGIWDNDAGDDDGAGTGVACIGIHFNSECSAIA